MIRTRLLTVIATAAVLVAPLLLSGPARAAAPCATPSDSTASHDGMISSGRYIVANDMWNTSGYAVSQRLSVCSYRSWNVTVSADDSAGDGAVKTYPNVHRDFINWDTNAQPRLRSFSSIRSRFASVAPDKGVYDTAYDVWLNALDREVMIWTQNHGQHPAGHRVGSVRVSGHRWTVWAERGNKYVAFVANQPLTQGTVNIKAMLGWLIRHHRLPASAKLAQIGYGFEMVSSGGSPSTFSVTDFNVATKRR